MKVITPGKPWSLKVKCDGYGNGSTDPCGAELEIGKEDLRYYSGTDYPIYRPAALTFRCPECKGLTDLRPEVWPNGREDIRPFSEAGVITL